MNFRIRMCVVSVAGLFSSALLANEFPEMLSTGGAWGIATNGAEYCFPADESGRPIQGSPSIPDHVCGVTFEFRGQSTGEVFCSLAKADGTFLKGGRLADDQALCEKYGYGWAKSAWTGAVKCFPKGKDGNILNSAIPVKDSKCF